MIKEIRIVFDPDHNLFRLRLKGTTIRLMSCSADYIKYSAERASSVFNSPFIEPDIDNILWLHQSNSPLILSDEMHENKWQNWAKYIYVDSLEESVKIGGMSMAQAKRFIKLEYPELLWTDLQEKTILNQHEKLIQMQKDMGLR